MDSQPSPVPVASRVYGLGLSQDLGFKVQGLGFTVLDFGSRVYGAPEVREDSEERP